MVYGSVLREDRKREERGAETAGVNNKMSKWKRKKKAVIIYYFGNTCIL